MKKNFMHSKFYFPVYLVILFSVILNAQDTIVINDADLASGNYHWTSDKIYLLDGEVILENGMLTIDSGTLIVARKIPSNDPEHITSLVISEGAQLIARGTQDDPIIFTGENIDDPFVEGANWRGIVISGTPGSTSGDLQYVSIRLAGASNEVEIGSALTLSKVDKSTIVHHVEIFISGGDGIRIRGGDVSIAYAAVSYIRDDGFDWDNGWTGNGIYWYVNDVGMVEQDPLPDDPGSFAIEGKNQASKSDTSVAGPRIFHTTLVGANCSIQDKATKGAIGLLNRAHGIIANSVFMHFPEYGIYIEDTIGIDDSYAAMQNGQLEIEANVWHDFGRNFLSPAGNKFSSGAGGLIATDSSTEHPAADALIDHLVDHFNLISSFGMIKNLNGSCIAIDPGLDPKNDYSKSPNVALPTNDFFNQFEAPLTKGAFGSDLWIKDWTALDQFDNFISVGEEAYGTFFFEAGPLNEIDTIIISCEDLPNLQDSLYFIFPCRPFQYQLGAAHRKGNPRRSRPNTRSDEQEYAFIERWEYFGNDPAGCSVAQELHLTILVFDTIAPIIHPVPDGMSGLTAITEDCDESRITSILYDTSTNKGTIRYNFFAEDYSGNTSSLVVDLVVGPASVEWYADFDKDGYGNPSAMIVATDSIPGYVQNDGDCNDSDPLAFPGSPGPDFQYFSDVRSVNYSCDSFSLNYDICAGALNIPAGNTCDFYLGDLEGANPTFYPDLVRSCLPRNYDDIWVKTTMPLSGGIHIQIEEDIFTLVDPSGFSRVFLAEIYSGDCQDLTLEYCSLEASTKLIFDFEDSSLAGQEIFIRLMEGGNINYTPIEICIIDLAEKVTNDFCSTASTLEIEFQDSCNLMTFNNYNAVTANGEVTSECHSEFAPVDVWFKFKAPDIDSFQFTIDTIAGSSFVKPIVIFYAGNCNQMTEIACFNYKNEGPSFIKQIKNPKSDGEIFMRIYDDFSAQGDFNLSLCYPPQTTVPVDEKYLGESLVIYPNPGSSSQNIQFELGDINSHSAWLSILDINGRLIMNKHFKIQNLKSGQFALKPGELQAGIYFVQLKTESEIYTKKLLLID